MAITTLCFLTVSQPSMLESTVNSPMNMKHYAKEKDIFKLAKVPFAEDTHNKALANAHVTVVTNQWTAEQLGAYYRSVAAPLIPVPAEVLEYKCVATKY
ncbi:hypothetical protein BDW62DRAFT_209574 [Aspergillus aurantiobrunneus]